MDITLPALPAGVLTLLALVAPYAIGALNGALTFVSKPWQKRALAIVVAALLAAAVLVFYFAYTGDAIPAWPALVLLAIVVSQASYVLLTKPTAASIESSVERRLVAGRSLRRDLR
jgi:predicted membrane metal-binding protein